MDKKVLTDGILRMVQEYRDQRYHGDAAWTMWTAEEAKALGILLDWGNLPEDLIA